MGADGIGSSSSSMTADDDGAEGGGRPRSYDRCRGLSVDEGSDMGDFLERAAWDRSSSVMRGRSTPQCFMMCASISSLSWISAVSGNSRRGISLGNRSFLSSGLLIGMFNTAFCRRSYSRSGLAWIMRVAQVSKPLGVKPGTSGRSLRLSSWTRWCSAFTSRNNREIEDVWSSKMSKRPISASLYSTRQPVPTIPWITIPRHIGVCIEPLELLRHNDNGVSRWIILNLPNV